MPRLGVQVEQQLHDARAGGGVEVAGGLVGEQHGGPRDEGARHRDALLLAAGELPRIVAGALAQAHASSTSQRAPRARRARPASSSGSITFSSAVSDGTRWKDWNTKPT